MVRETRHLWVGNLPDNIREDRIREHFKRYGRVQNVKLLGRAESASAGVGATGASGVCAAVAFMDIKSASKAHNAEHVLDERTLTTEYYEPAAIPSTAGAPSAGSSPAGSGYSGSSSSVNSVPAPSSASRYHLSGGEDSSGATTCPLAASAAAPATWRGTNDSATDYCRRGNTPAAYGRYQRNNITAPYSTPPSNFERTTPHHRWYVGAGGGSGATGGESTPSTPGGCTESGRRRRLSGSASSRSDSSSPEPSDTSRASTPATQPPLSHHSNHRTPPAVSHQWASTSNGRPLSICVRNLPTRSTDSSLKDGLYHEYKKHGKVVWVKVVGQNADRYAIVRFKKPSDVEKALEVSQDKLFFGCKISVAPHQSCDDDADSTKPYETDIDEYHPKATRTLFIGNLEKDVTQQQLRDKFKHFGRIIEIDIKKGSGGGAGYAFCQYASISSVVEAIRAMDGEYVGGSRVKLGFGKPVATACVWVDGLTEHTEKQVLGAVSRCGAATSVCVDRAAGAALVHFEQAAAAGAAVRELRRVAAAASAAEPAHPRLCVDYASRECQEAFYEQLEKHGGSAALAGSERLSGGELSTRYVPSTRHDSIRYEGCGSRSRASSYGRSSSRTPRYSALEHYDPVDYAADRRYRVYDETGASSPLEDSPFEDRLQSVVVSPHRARRHCRDSSTEDRKHSKERRRSAGGGGGGGVRRSRSGSAGRERHTARRKHRRRHDGSGSRAGTPLRDEPDAPPAEPRRPPRDRPSLPMCLPLPKFAAQLLRTAPPAPHPAPQPTSAPDSPPRPPSVSSSSGGSAPHSPSLEERIRSLDEKYEKWSGSRAITDAPDRARLRHRLLEVDINEVKPSEVVSVLLAKRSVFDEDSERLECVVRAPSPPDGQGRGAAQRVPRFPPLPTQPPPTCAAYSVPHHVTLEVDASDRPCDPRLNRPERPCRLEKLGKINESDYGECRLRPRTPSTDRSQPDSCDRRTPPALVDGDAESRSRDSASGTCDAESKSSFDMDDKEIDLGIKRERSNSSTSDSLLTGKSEATSANALLQNTSDVSHENKRLDDSQHFHLDQKCARDVIDMIIKKVESGQKFELQSDVPCKVPNEESKFEFFKQGGPCHLLDSETKIAICEGIRKSDSNKIQTFNQSLTNKDSVEYELHLHHNHLASTINKEKDVINSVVNNCSDKNDKEHNISQLYQITKPEKENIQMEKKLEKEKQSCNSDTPPADKKLLITDKNVENRGVRSDRDKAKHNKERLIKEKHDCEKDKLKNYRNEKHMERNEKDRSLKDDCSIERKHIDKIDKSKVEKDTEKLYKEKTETDKSKNFDDKSRHDHHKKDKPEKDKRKDSDLGLLHSKSKKDERHKSEKQKKDVDIKRENKKEIEHIKTRKLSRDESSKEVSRKDSTDSSTSRTSHESAKSKDLDNHDNIEDIKPKVKLTDLFFKLETDKGSSDSKDVKVEHSVVKIKSEIKEEKCVIGAMLEPHIKPKAEIIEKHRHHSLDSPSVDSKRKERLNSCSSLPSNIGHKRRISSHDSFDSVCEEAKKIKNEHKLPDRRDSKDSRSGDKHKATKFSKGHFAKIIESKTKDDKKGQVKPLDEAALLEFKENNDTKNSSIKGPKKLPKEDNNENIIENNEEAHNNLDFLALFELRSSEEDERQKALRKEMKEKKRIQQLQQIQELQMQQDAMQQGELLGKLKDDKKQKSEDKKKDAAREKRFSIDRKSREEKIDNNKKKNRKLVQSSDTSDSDEPKKHSIFDIIDDGPTYISMYDKVKARSCKNMQKQEEEKRQEKIKAKFSQLKQSRAKREEKKRSSWDEDSDSEHEVRKNQKSSLDNSSDEEEIHDKRRDKLQMGNLDFDDNRTEEYFSTPNDDDLRNKLARKNSRSRIMSDSSGDDTSKSKSPHYHNDAKKLNMSDLDSLETSKIDGAKDLDDQIKKSSLLHLFGKSDSDDSKLKSNIDDDGTYKLPSFKPMCNDLSSESESVTSNRNVSEFRRKHKKKPKKYKSTFSDEENKINHTDSGIGDGENRHKMTEKQRRHSSKKDKRREKNRESIDTDEGGRDDKLKLRREKRSPDNVIAFEYGPDVVSNTTKRDGKMEDIFGPLSDESDKDTEPQSKSEFPCYDFDFIKDKFNSTELKLKEKDDFKRKKEKKRKEKRWLREDDNSLDMDAVSKAIEARLFAESFTDDETRIRMEAPHENMRRENNEDDKYMDSNSLNEVVKFNNKHDKLRRDSREKKKKKKRNKEERQNRKEQNPFYHNTESLQKSDNEMTERPTLETMTNTMLLDIPLPNDSQAVDEKTDEGKSLEESPSLPRLTESPPILIQSIHDVETKSGASSSSSNILGDNDNNIYLESKSIEIEQIPMPPPFENIVQDISEVPLPTDPEPTSLSAIKSNSFIATLSSDSDLSEDAVQSLSVMEADIDKTVKINTTQEKPGDRIDATPSKVEKKAEEKPRAIISQEETEDAVAALLGESFGGKINIFSNYEETENNAAHQNDSESTSLSTANIPEEDAEEMRQAVQNLNACEMELKPDTPVSDNDLLLIDTDNEETDETPQDSSEKIPINIVAAHVPLINNVDKAKTAEEPQIHVSKPSIESNSTKAHLEGVNKSNDKDIQIKLPRRENVHLITSTATPVITSWTLTNNKILEPHVINIQPNIPHVKDKIEGKTTHITANIVQIKTSQNQNLQINNIVKPVTPTRVSAPYQVIGQMVRPQVSNMQPPTIKIPEPHILYQKSQGIVVSPRMANDPRMQSPKASPQSDGMTSPRLPTIPVLSSSPQNPNSSGLVSPNLLHQRSPGQVTVVRVQQPPLSPIQAMHLPPGARTMVSPSRPNSVLVQTQRSPHHHSRLPVTPLLTPIPKQINIGTVLHQPNIGIAGNNNPPLLTQQKIITGDVRRNELRNMSDSKDNSKIILPASTSLQHSTNPTVMAQNRLISMQNAVHIGNINSSLHINNKFVINKMTSLNEKRENIHQKDHGSHQVPFVSSPIIHVAGVNHSTPSIIQSGTKQAMCNLQEASNISRGQASNVIHTLNSQRLLTPASISNVRHLEMNKVSPSVLAMATIRPSTVLTKLETTNISTVTTSNVTNVKTPILIKSSPAIGTIRLSSKPEKDNVLINTSVLQKETNKIEKEQSSAADGNNLIKQAAFTLNTMQNSSEEVAKCETDFEELLKDNTNKIIITKDSDKKIEGNVEKTTTLISKQSHDKPHIPNNEYSFQVKEQEVPTTDLTALEFSSFERKDDMKNEFDDLNKTNNLMEPSEETLSKENTSQLINVKQSSKDNTTKENLQLHKDKSFSPMLGTLLDKAYENVSIEKNVITSLDITKIDKTDDFPKESPNLSEMIENQLKTLDENDSWSAKDLNIESVIKKVDSLCNESIESFQTSRESQKSENPEKVKSAPELATETTILEDHSDHVNIDNAEDSPSENIAHNANLNTYVKVSTPKRGGRSIRAKKSEKNQDRVQTRQIAKAPRGGATAKRGRGRAKVDKKVKNLVTCNTSTIPGDIYDFHEDSGDEGSNKAEPRPRLILTIKSPISGQVGVTATSTLSIAQKEQNKFEERRPSRDDKLEDFVSPSPNTRKSRRLQEKDVHRSAADDIGEDGARNSRSAKRRPIRQAVVGKPTNCEKTDKALAADTRKSSRGIKRTRDRSLSDASIDSGDGDGRRDEITREPKVPRIEEPVAPPADPEPSIALRSASSLSVAPSHTSNAISSHVTPTIPTPAALNPVSSIVPEPAPPVDPLVAVSIAPKLVVPNSSAILVSTSPMIAVSTSPTTQTIAVSISSTNAVTVPPSVAASSSSLLAPSVAQPVIPPVVPLSVPPVTPIVPSLAAPPPAPTPITKPPKKMISEISAKLAGAFEASGQHRPAAEPPAGAPGEAQLGEARRPGDNVPCAMLPVGATEAADARVQSPALPHRPPVAQRVVVDRATPILIRGGEGEAGAMGALGAMGAAGAGGARYRALVAGSGGPASLPRGAHHPPPEPPPLAAAHHQPLAPLHHRAHPGAASRITSVPSISPQGQLALGEGMYPHFSQQHFQMYQQHFRATQHERATPSPYTRIEAEGTEAPTSPLELRRISARVPRPAHSPSPADRHIMYAVVCGRSPPPAHGGLARAAGALPPGGAPGPPHASQVPHEADSLQMLLRRYPVMWQGLLALKNDSAAVQMHFVGGNPGVASETLARPPDLVTPMLRIAQRMRLEPMQLDQVHRKMKLENEHCILLALPCGRDHMDVLQQSTNLSAGFITYLQRKTAAGIVNIAPPGHQQAMFTVHVFPSCDFANENLSRIAPDLMHRVANIAHLLIVIATV